MKHKLSTLFLVLILLAGVSLLLYPTVSDYWNSFHASQAVASYSADVQNLDQARYDELWSAARDYNQSLLKRENGYFLTDEQRAQYDSLLDITGTGIMGYIEIPTIKLSLPIYQGRRIPFSRSPSAISTGPRSRPAEKAPTVCSPAIAACPARSSSPTSTSSSRAIRL